MMLRFILSMQQYKQATDNGAVVFNNFHSLFLHNIFNLNLLELEFKLNTCILMYLYYFIIVLI